MTTVEDDFRSTVDGANQYGSYQNAQSPLDISHSHSINTIQSLHRDYIISEDLLAGQRLDGRMSNVRRFFCLFVTFDFLFTTLMWLICVMLNGEYLITALTEQIVHYSIHTSLFDIVTVAFLRFGVLIVFYAIIYINHWIVISISTTLTCAFLTAKVFVFDWPHSSQPVFEVLLVLTNFVLSWGEAWFLDYRVLPQEGHADRYLISNAETERAPLIQRYVQGLPSNYTESVNFYSPVATPNGSLYRFDESPVLGRIPPVIFNPEEERKYKELALKTLHDALELFGKSDWKLLKQQGEDSVYSRNDVNAGKIFKLTGQVNIAPKILLDELYFKVEDMPKWNNSIKESLKVQAIDEHTDITYQVSSDGAAGIVSSRDFVNLRHWAKIDGRFVLASVKTEHPSIPEKHRFVRAENGVGCYVIEPVESDANRCNFVWIVNTNLKLNKWIPKAVLDKELPKMMLNYVKDLRQHLNKSLSLGKYD